MSTRLYIDFDGTVTRSDVGTLFFRTFGGPVCDEYVRLYRAEELSARECFEAEARSVARVDPDAFRAFLAAQEVDTTLRELADYCSARLFPLVILSDGLDGYLRPLLAAHGLNDLPSFSNTMTLAADGTMTVAFPHENGECDRCGCCKRNLLLTGGGDRDVIVYAGDGHADRCPAGYADVVFARGALQTYCQEQNISYYPFRDFRDVVRTLERLSARRELRLRPRALIRRRDAFLAEA
jgi:2,3-diketo-5-methylthio-1-phosphopentane phosphatase